MEDIFRNMEDVEVYIVDDIGIRAQRWEHHQTVIVDEMLSRLKYNGFTVNPLKCKWAAVYPFDGMWYVPDSGQTNVLHVRCMPRQFKIMTSHPLSHTTIIYDLLAT
jgi:hypothetical protein